MTHCKTRPVDRNKHHEPPHRLCLLDLLPPPLPPPPPLQRRRLNRTSGTRHWIAMCVSAAISVARRVYETAGPTTAGGGLGTAFFFFRTRRTHGATPWDATDARIPPPQTPVVDPVSVRSLLRSRSLRLSRSVRILFSFPRDDLIVSNRYYWDFCFPPFFFFFLIQFRFLAAVSFIATDDPNIITGRIIKDKDGNDVEVLDPDEVMEQYRRETGPKTDFALDHILLGCCDLDEQMKAFHVKTGVDPVLAVSLRGCGTKSARLAFEGCACFLEIVGPDDKQPDTELKRKLKELPPGKLVPIHYAIRSSKIEESMDAWSSREMNLQPDKVTMVAQDNGVPWKWDICILGGHDQGGLVPMFIWWGDAMHWSGKLPVLGTIDKVKVSAPEDSVVHRIFAEEEGFAGVHLSVGEPSLQFSFTSPKGEHTFRSEDPIGIMFPSG